MTIERGCPLRAGTREEFSAARRAMDCGGYTEERIAARLGVARVIEFVPLRNGRETATETRDALDVLIRLFLDGECVAAAEAERLLPPGTLPALETLGLAARMTPDLWYGTVAVYPVDGLLIAADRSSDPAGGEYVPPPDVVYPPLDQTVNFLEILPPLPCGRLLDIGTGSGAAALTAASRYAERAWAVDIAARSAHYAEFNSLWNGLANVTAGCGNLYEPVRGLKFDRIVAHPPYVAVPRSTHVFRDGGEDGEQVIRGIVEGLPEHLEPGGRFYGYGMASDREGEAFEDRIRRWLAAKSSEFDVLLTGNGTFTPDMFKSPRGEEERRHWELITEKLKITHFFHGAFLIQRHASDAPAFTVRVLNGDRSGWREAEWLRQWMTVSSAPGFEQVLLEAKPALSPWLEVRTTYRVKGGRLGPDECLLVSDYPFHVECVCQPWLVEVLSGCDGKSTGWQQFSAAQRRGGPAAGGAPEDFARVLRGMITGGFLATPLVPGAVLL